MSKEDIVINGVSINELKKQREAIRQGASQLISEKVNLAKSLTEQLMKSEEAQEIERLAEQAYEALDTAQLVSNVSGVTFYLPFYEEYSYSNDEVFSRMLEGSDNEVLAENWDGAVSRLYNIFEDMESQSCEWHSSRC